MHAGGMLLHWTLLAGSTFSTDGAIPKLHISCAPDVTIKDTFDLLSPMMVVLYIEVSLLPQSIALPPDPRESHRLLPRL